MAKTKKPVEVKNEAVIEHEATAEDIENNPELKDVVEVGEVIEIPEEAVLKPLESLEEAFKFLGKSVIIRDGIHRDREEVLFSINADGTVEAPRDFSYKLHQILV